MMDLVEYEKCFICSGLYNFTPEKLHGLKSGFLGGCFVAGE